MTDRDATIAAAAEAIRQVCVEQGDDIDCAEQYAEALAEGDWFKSHTEPARLTDAEQAVIEAASRHQTRMQPTVAAECAGESPRCGHEDECPVVGHTPVCGACFDDEMERHGEVWDDGGLKPSDCPICVAIDALNAERGRA